MRNLSNISRKELRKVLAAMGLTFDCVNAGHEYWVKKGLRRPVVFQTHVDPVPEFIIRNAIQDMGTTRTEFLKILENL